ncbi:MAG TPA: chaperone modulator CbpM [Saprospiraceae bacterium]|mgnify:CR=1 FL=1|nr:chaperone modulator CbpM [Saprospiraceae bacterium]HPK08965.1 chaperone modulator CbpM [Saprospiraceae bacterium]HPQ21473.1 chaperone modulator CbpM [Saprospiraceae bacterium]HRX28581.1 chaperone modulator CbpM [Saprospiraceae bacterium]
MEDIQRISIRECSIHYNIDRDFIDSLHDCGLLEIVYDGDDSWLDVEQLADFERYMRMHYDLDINLAGIEAIKHLLDRMERLENEILRMQNLLA